MRVTTSPFNFIVISFLSSDVFFIMWPFKIGFSFFLLIMLTPESSIELFYSWLAPI